MSTRHAKFCDVPDRKAEPVCECGHPLCLHRAYAPGNPLMKGRIDACRSQYCSPAINEECDSFSDAREEA